MLLCVALGALITTLSTGEFFGSAHFWRYFFANITLMNFIEPTMPGVFDGNLVAAVNGSLWTIKAEVLLYFTVPVIYVLAQRFGKTREIVTVFALLTVAFTGCVYVYETTGNEAINMLAHKVLLPFGYFYAGTAILLYLEKKNAQSRKNARDDKMSYPHNDLNSSHNPLIKDLIRRWQKLND